MPENKIHILSTKSLDPALVVLAAQQGIVIDALPFIGIGPLPETVIGPQIAPYFHLPATVAFTSRNAVEAVEKVLPATRPDWNIFCIGQATRKAVEKVFGPSAIAGTAADATGLVAGILARSQAPGIIFFCGNLRRDELPQRLSAQGLTVKEILVYTTRPTPHVIQKNYDGIFFFSPSAVDSFFSTNTTGPGSILFAIGHTTATAIQNFTKNKIVISDTAARESLVRTAIRYFRNHPVHD